MFELARGVERIRVDDGEPGAQRAEQRDRVLQDVRQHDRDPVATLQFRALLQPGCEVARAAVVLGVGDGAAEAGEGVERREALAARLEQRRERGIFVRIDLRRHAGWIVLQPDLVHFLSTGLQSRPQIVQQSRLGCGRRMDAVGLHQLLVQRDPLEKESDQRRFVTARQLAIECMKAVRIGGAVVRRHAHADQHDLGAGGLGTLDQELEVLAHLPQRQSAQPVVAAELQDDDCRMMQLQRARQASPRAAGRVAADAGIHHAVSVTLSGETLLQQRHPGCIDGDAVAGAQAVADDQDDRLACRRIRVNRQRQRQSYPS